MALKKKGDFLNIAVALGVFLVIIIFVIPFSL